MGGEPHPVTGQPFDSPVPPGSGWPGDPATSETPVARAGSDVARLAAAAATVRDVDALSSVCRACPRLVEWRETVAVSGRRAAFAAQPYWRRPGPSFGDPSAQKLIVGLAPAANGTNRTGRMFTGDRSGDWLYAALHRTGYANQPQSVAAGDGLELTGLRILASVRCAPPANRPLPAELATCGHWLGRDLALTAASPTGLVSVLALGGIAWNAVLAAARRLGWDVPRPKPAFGHGAEALLGLPDWLSRGGAVRLVGCYHVSPHNTSTKRLTEEMLDAALLRL